MNNNKDRIFGSFNKTTLHQVLFGAPFVYPAFNTIEPTYSSTSPWAGFTLQETSSMNSVLPPPGHSEKRR